MNFLTAILDALIGFVRRNPLTVLVVLILALAAPAVLKGIAIFILYFILGLIVLGVALMLLFRWKIYSVRRQMEDRFPQDGFGSPFAGQQQERQPEREGDVKVHATSETLRKRVSGDVGDYVEFEEQKEK